MGVTHGPEFGLAFVLDVVRYIYNICECVCVCVCVCVGERGG